MKKIIRLTESELVSLVKRTIMEDDKMKLDIQSDILTYQGTNKDLLKFKYILDNVGFLNDDQIKQAQEIISKENSSNNELTWDSIYNFQSKISDNGKKLYDRVKEDDSKKKLFKTNNYEFNFPSEKWVEDNIESLKKFEENLPTEFLSKPVKLVLGDKPYEHSLKKWIDGLINALKTKSPFFTSLLKIEAENFEWTILPKLDTNYSNWGKWILSLDKLGKLGKGTPSEKIDIFFEDRPIKQVVSLDDTQTIEHIKKIQKNHNVQFPKLSFAEYKWLKDALNDYKQTFVSISKSTDKGDLEERNFIGQLKIYSRLYGSEWKIIGNDDIINFSTPGNQVDMFFGVDMIVRFHKFEKNDEGKLVPTQIFKSIPVQVKSSENAAKKALIRRLGINGISVFREGDEWFYFDSGSKKKSFEKDFLKIH